MATGQDLKMAGKLMFILVILPKGLEWFGSIPMCHSYAERAWPSPPKRAIRALDTRRKPCHIAIHQQWEDRPSLKGVIPSHSTLGPLLGTPQKGCINSYSGVTHAVILVRRWSWQPRHIPCLARTSHGLQQQRHKSTNSMVICIVQR